MTHKTDKMQILFVCTGNTCRSPMAQAIARAVLKRTGRPEVEVLLESAGTGAYRGMPASPQVAGALENLGISPDAHQSQPLTRQLLAQSDAIYAMSDWHLREIAAMDPQASARAQLIDPEGNDIPDPVGLPQEVYNQTAKSLNRMITRQLDRLGLLEP